MRFKDATETYRKLKEISEEILGKLGMDTEPKGRTRPWEDGRFRGLIYHYTGGPSGVKSMRWGNDLGWGNKSSSWHVTIFDTVPNDELGRMWYDLTDDDLKWLFPAPTIIMASWDVGTWHANWTNRYTLGIENRNVGCNWRRLGSRNQAEVKLGKKLQWANKDYWEPYTREQIVSNINIGRVANGFIDGQLNPDFILPHSAVWATKQDTGPLFPLVSIRHSIFSTQAIIDITWLEGFNTGVLSKNYEPNRWNHTDDIRESEPTVWVSKVPDVDDLGLRWARPYLYALGFNAMTGNDESLREQVMWFQQSTAAYKQVKKPKYVLKADGYCGPKTKEVLEYRVKSMGIYV